VAAEVVGILRAPGVGVLQHILVEHGLVEGRPGLVADLACGPATMALGIGKVCLSSAH
jgi:hypothetical protein